MPDMVLREDQLIEGLAQLCEQVGVDAVELPENPNTHPIELDDIYDAEIESATRDIYQRDYMMFGFKALG